MTDDFLRDCGVKVLGTRLRRLFERLNVNVTELYRNELQFEQRWFALGMLLRDKGALDSTAASHLLGQSHVAIAQVVSGMEKAGLLERREDPVDRRRRTLALTASGVSRLDQVDQISRKIERAAEKLLEEAAPDFMSVLDALDDALQRKDFSARIDDEFQERITASVVADHAV